MVVEEDLAAEGAPAHLAEEGAVSGLGEGRYLDMEVDDEVAGLVEAAGAVGEGAGEADAVGGVAADLELGEESRAVGLFGLGEAAAYLLLEVPSLPIEEAVGLPGGYGVDSVRAAPGDEGGVASSCEGEVVGAVTVEGGVGVDDVVVVKVDEVGGADVVDADGEVVDELGEGSPTMRMTVAGWGRAWGRSSTRHTLLRNVTSMEVAKAPVLSWLSVSAKISEKPPPPPVGNRPC